MDGKERTDGLLMEVRRKGRSPEGTENKEEEEDGEEDGWGRRIKQEDEKIIGCEGERRQGKGGGEDGKREKMR